MVYARHYVHFYNYLPRIFVNKFCNKPLCSPRITTSGSELTYGLNCIYIILRIIIYHNVCYYGKLLYLPSTVRWP